MDQYNPVNDNSRGRLATTVVLQLSEGVWKGKWENWESVLWTTKSQIPVGEFRAQFKVNRQDGVATKQIPFYVVFRIYEFEEGRSFLVPETAIWFGAGHNSSHALSYALHPDDRRIFEIAIREVNGETNTYDAAYNLSHWVANHFDWDLRYHTNDTIDLLLHHNSAQCADEAAFLVAMLHAVRIPAHPVTADAASEVDELTWGFDTWVEARLEGPGIPENWYVLHPHLYKDKDPDTGLRPTIKPTLRSVFGKNYGVATKSYNDLIIMADVSWLTKIDEISDGEHDVKFERNGCDEPMENFNHIASWVDHLCQDYWSDGHWECPPSRIAPRTRLQIVPARARLVVGEDLDFRTIVSAERAIEDTLVVRVVSNDIRSSMWPDSVLAEISHPVGLSIDESRTFDDRFQIPEDFTTSDELLLEARIGENYAIVPIEIAPRFE
jgi:hypothetical protein